MLTNTKKIFVRSISMLLVLLMVAALCLTGCGNKSADDAYAKAEEAKTAADEVKAALDGYIKKEDKAAAEALIDQILGGDITLDDIAALNKELKAFVDDEESLEAAIAAAVANGNYMTKSEVEALIKQYFNPLDEKVSVLLSGLTPEKANQALKDAMSLPEWDKTSDVVLETIEEAQSLLKKLFTNTYTQENKYRVNSIIEELGISGPFKYNNSTKYYDNMSTTTYQTFVKMLEYALLRVATTEEMEEFNAIIEKANAVATYQTELNDLLTNYLYASGTLQTAGTWNGTTFTASKYTTDYVNYAGQIYRRNTDVKVQVLTLADKANYHNFVFGYDKLIAKYAADGIVTGNSTVNVNALDYGARNGGNWPKDFELICGWPNALQTGSDANVTMTVYEIYKNGTTINAYAKGYTGTKVGTYVGLSMSNDATYLDKYVNGVAETEVVWSPVVQAFTGAVGTVPHVVTDKFNGLNNSYTPASTAVANQYGGDTALNNSLMGLIKSQYTQLSDIQTLANAASMHFTGSLGALTSTVNSGFLFETVKQDASISTADITKITDEQWLNALQDYMCEKFYNSPAQNIYLLEDSATEEAVADVVELFTYANSGNYHDEFGGLNKADLYQKMMDKSFDLLFDVYKVKALDAIAQIYRDYLSISYTAVAQVATGWNGTTMDTAAVEGTNTTYTTAYETGIIGTMNGVDATDALTAGFIALFLTGKDSAGATAFADGTIYATLGLANKFANDNLADYYADNGAALVMGTVSTGEELPSYIIPSLNLAIDPMKTIADKKQALDEMLNTANFIVWGKINNATKDEMKKVSNNVQTCFYDLLKEGIENLDEIYDRYLLNDYKAMVTNVAYAQLQDIIDFYQDDASVATVTDKYPAATTLATLAYLEQYLTGFDSNTNDDGLKVETKAATTAGKILITKVEYASNNMEETLTNGALVTALGAITMSMYDDIATHTAAAKMDAADAAVAAVIDTVEDLLVREYIFNYLETANDLADKLTAAHMNYLKSHIVFGANMTLLSTVSAAEWLVRYDLNVIKTAANRNEYTLDQYKDKYVEGVLSLVAVADALPNSNYQGANQHLLLTKYSIEEILAFDATTKSAKLAEVVAELVKAVKSTTQPADATAWTPYTTTISGMIVGSYAVDLDKLINTIPSYEYKYSTAAGLVQLYQ